jgi:trk system potassium uptake protein TrkH
LFLTNPKPRWGWDFSPSFCEKTDLTRILFEVSSALGTVGLSAGLTGMLTDFGKVVLIVLMFIGRLGVIIFGLAVMARRVGRNNPSEEDDLAV